MLRFTIILVVLMGCVHQLYSQSTEAVTAAEIATEGGSVSTEAATPSPMEMTTTAPEEVTTSAPEEVTTSAPEEVTTAETETTTQAEEDDGGFLQTIFGYIFSAIFFPITGPFNLIRGVFG
nr:mucin-5AC [Parasteatoda tepidariorum]